MKDRSTNPIHKETLSIRKKTRQKAFGLAFLIFIVLIFLGWIIGNIMETRMLSEAKVSLSKDISLIGANLTENIDNKLSVIHGLDAFIVAELQSHGEVVESHLLLMSEELYKSSTGILNIAVAPDGIFKFVYPFEENKSVIGYEPGIDTRPSVRDDVRRAIETKEIILSLPIELIQGGTGLIARQAIFDDGNYWGLSSIVIEIQPIFEESEITNGSNEITFALVDQAGNLFFGPEEIFAKDPVSSPVYLQEGQWELVGIPSDGWQSYYYGTLLSYRLLGLAIIFLITGWVYLIYFRQIRLSYLVKLRTEEVIETNKLLQEDIRKRKQVEEELIINQSRLEKVISQTPIPIVITKANGDIESFNQNFVDQFGYTLKDVSTAEGWWQAVYPDKDYRLLVQQTWEKAIAKAETTGDKIETQEWDMTRKDGGIRTVEFNMMPLGDISVIAMIDITEKKQAELDLQHMATHDVLTNLPNRALLNDRLNHACARADRNKKVLYVLFLDLDGFKSINDAYGHQHGDLVLQGVAERIKESVRESDTIARIGGDEFAILLEGIEKTKDVLLVTEKIISNISKPFKILDSEAYITASIGISRYPSDGNDPDLLMQNADRAMYRSKEKGGDNFQFYSPKLETQMLKRIALRNKLERALEKLELKLFYQPQVDSKTGQVIGVEALLRWQHPTLGLLAPHKFLSHAEESGLIVPIGAWVLDNACHQLKNWVDQGYTSLRLGINISQPELNRKDFLELINNTLEKYSLPPHSLEIELTENIVFKDMGKALPLLQTLKEMGIRLAIDDFGTGYSKLSQLANFSFDTIKIDQLFAPHVINSPNDAAVVTSLINIAQNLNFEVIAEGVENDEQLAFYEALGCDHIQGYIFSKPVPPEEISFFLENGIQKLPILKS